jgi:hypothetical protein
VNNIQKSCLHLTENSKHLNHKNFFKVRIAVYCENHKKRKYIVGKMYGFVMINLVVHIFTTVVTGKNGSAGISETLHISALHVVTYRRTVGVIRNFINF